LATNFSLPAKKGEKVDDKGKKKKQGRKKLDPWRPGKVRKKLDRKTRF